MLNIQTTTGVSPEHGVAPAGAGQVPGAGARFSQVMDNYPDTAGRADDQAIHAIATRTDEISHVVMDLRSTVLEPGVRVDAAEPLLRRMDAIEAESRALEGYVNLYQGGHVFDQAELLTLQIRMHDLTRSIELLAKTVEHSVGGLKSLLQTNV